MIYLIYIFAVVIVLGTIVAVKSILLLINEPRVPVIMTITLPRDINSEMREQISKYFRRDPELNRHYKILGIQGSSNQKEVEIKIHGKVYDQFKIDELKKWIMKAVAK